MCVDQSTQTGPKIKIKYYTEHLWKTEYKNECTQTEEDKTVNTYNYTEVTIQEWADYY